MEGRGRRWRGGEGGGGEGEEEEGEEEEGRGGGGGEGKWVEGRGRRWRRGGRGLPSFISNVMPWFPMFVSLHAQHLVHVCQLCHDSVRCTHANCVVMSCLNHSALPVCQLTKAEIHLGTYTNYLSQALKTISDCSNVALFPPFFSSVFIM